MATWSGRGDWWVQAACQSADPELFFPISAAGASAAVISRAKGICARCAIRQQCLEYAVETRQPHGIWGGTSEAERRLIVARRRKLEPQVS
jgi:WhiB family transcriptional regulator, redox-sensing transcriptional regulator